MVNKVTVPLTVSNFSDLEIENLTSPRSSSSPTDLRNILQIAKSPKRLFCAMPLFIQ